MAFLRDEADDEGSAIVADNARQSEFFKANPHTPAEPDWDDLTPQEQQERREQDE